MMGSRLRIAWVVAVVLVFAAFVGQARAKASVDARSWAVGAPTWGLFMPDHPYDWVWGVVTVCLFVVLVVKLVRRR